MFYMNQFRLKNDVIVSKKKILHKSGYIIVDPHKNNIIFTIKKTPSKNKISIPFSEEFNGFKIPSIILEKYDLKNKDYEWVDENSFVINCPCSGKLPSITENSEIKDKTEIETPPQNLSLDERVSKLEHFILLLQDTFSK